MSTNTQKISSAETIDLERQRLECEKAKAERDWRLEIRRYRLERLKTNREYRFLNKNLGIIISAAISVSALVVSAGQVWVAKISREKELQLAAIHKQAENERLEKQRDRELSIQSAEQERQWNLSRARFITENRKTIFQGSPKELNQMSLIIETLFTREVAMSMFVDFQRTATSPETQRIWSNAKQRLQKRVSVSRPTEADVLNQVSGIIVDENQNPLSGAIVGFSRGENTSVAAITNSNGHYAARYLLPGTYTITVSLTGYIEKVGQVTVFPDATVRYNANLTKDTP